MISIAYLASFNRMYLSKDCFLIPYYLAKEQEVPLQLVYGSNLGNVELPNDYRGVILKGKQRKKVCKLNETTDWFYYILPKARHIKSLFFCGCSAHHMLLTWLLLKLNSKIEIIVFGDMEEPQAQDFYETGTVYGKGLVAWGKRRITHFFFNHVKFPVANERAYRIMIDTYKKYDWKGLVSLHPCLDDELFNQLGVKYRSWDEKENIMISVGRIGNHQKNTDMLLEALSYVDLKDWKVYMIGPITDGFEIGGSSSYQMKIDDFFNKNPQLRNRLIFKGMIYDQKILFSYFAKAKVYLSSARHEGFANVYSQAAACGCYIISTDVGGAETASNKWKFGKKVEQEDPKGMADIIQHFIANSNTVDLSSHPNQENFLYSKAIKCLTLV